MPIHSLFYLYFTFHHSISAQSPVAHPMFNHSKPRSTIEHAVDVCATSVRLLNFAPSPKGNEILREDLRRKTLNERVNNSLKKRTLKRMISSPAVSKLKVVDTNVLRDNCKKTPIKTSKETKIHCSSENEPFCRNDLKRTAITPRNRRSRGVPPLPPQVGGCKKQSANCQTSSPKQIVALKRHALTIPDEVPEDSPSPLKMAKYTVNSASKNTVSHIMDTPTRKTYFKSLQGLAHRMSTRRSYR